MKSEVMIIYICGVSIPGWLCLTLQSSCLDSRDEMASTAQEVPDNTHWIGWVPGSLTADWLAYLGHPAWREGSCKM